QQGEFMKKLFLFALSLGMTFSTTAFADLMGYDCVGTYNSKQKADDSDPSTVSVKATLHMEMLGDENANGEYTATKVNLKMVATNEKNEDAGTIYKRNFKGQVNQAHSA